MGTHPPTSPGNGSGNYVLFISRTRTRYNECLTRFRLRHVAIELSQALASSERHTRSPLRVGRLCLRTFTCSARTTPTGKPGENKSCRRQRRHVCILHSYSSVIVSGELASMFAQALRVVFSTAHTTQFDGSRVSRNVHYDGDAARKWRVATGHRREFYFMFTL